MRKTKINKVYLTTSFKFCKTNAYLGSQLYSFFERNGFWIVDNPEEADFIIITTCAFDKRRENEALSLLEPLIERFASKKQIIVCGCLPKINRDLPRDKRMIAVGPKELTKFDEIFSAKIKMEDVYTGKLNKYFCSDRIGELEYGYIQIGQGCVNNCSYCIIKKAKGNIESKAPEQILREFKLGIKSGLRKFFLLADDCGSYGLDIKTNFAKLLNLLCGELGDSFDSLGILYFEPNRLIKLYPYIDKKVFKKIDSLNVPIQTVSVRLLKLMNRNYSIKAVLNILADIKRINPKIDLRTHLIYGFPGESRKDFSSLFSLFGHFDLMSCFYYSDREGTRAYNLGGKVPRSEIMYRTSVIMRMDNQAADQAKLKTKIELAYQPKTIFDSIAKTVPPGPIDVLLVYLASGKENDASVYPLGLLESAEPLVRNNIKVKILDARQEPYLSRKIIELAGKNKLIRIGFVGGEPAQIEEINRLVRRIKSRFAIPVVVEGSLGSKAGRLLKAKRIFRPLPHYLLSEYFPKYRIARIQTGNNTAQTIINKIKDLFLYVDDKYVDFIEDDFLKDATRAKEFAAKLLVEIKNGKIYSFPWSFQTRVESLAHVSFGLLKSLKKSGLDSIRVDADSYLDNENERGSNGLQAGKVIKARGFLKALNINVRYPD